MMILALLLTGSFAWGSSPFHWSGLLEFRERHEFYKDNEVILRPVGSWQTLFAVVYPARDLRLYKDCVYYRVPGEFPGVFKIKSVGEGVNCERHLEDKGDSEIGNLKALQFSLDKEISIQFTFTDFRSIKWNIPYLNRKVRSASQGGASSAQYRAPKLLLLAALKQTTEEKILPKQAQGELCHSIGDDCLELSSSSCHQCPEGWYEVPNGCPQGPKYCGVDNCGLKNRPACRRGVKWQRVEKKFDCRTDTSFAYCAPALVIQCEGGRAYCR